MRVKTILQWEASDQRTERFRRILLAARNTDYYRPRLEAAGLASPEAVATLCSVEEGLERLPAGDLRAFKEDSEPFRNRSLRAAPLQLEFEGVSPNAWWRRLGIRANVISGPLSALDDLAREVLAGHAPVPPSLRRITVHSRIDRELLQESQRDFLWHAFRVPIFEEVRGFDNEVLAWECEVHSGLHVRGDCAVVEASGNAGGGEIVLTSLTSLHYPMLRMLTGLVGRCQGGLCECGDRSNRVVFPPPLRMAPAWNTGWVDYAAQAAAAM